MGDAPAPDPAGAYRALAPRVLGYLRGRGAADPEDLLGEVFLHVARDAHRFVDWEDPVAVRRWVFTIARNRLVDAGRRARRRPGVAPGATVPEGEAPAPPGGLDPELLAALAALGEEQREVVLLRFVADLSLEDVATLTGRSAGAVKSLQHRALDNLRRAVSPEPPPTL